MTDDNPPVVIEGKTFGPTDTVVLDGHHFIRCTFNGCEIAFSGGDFTHEACTFGKCDLVFYGAAHRTRLVLEWCGYTITSPFGENPETKFPQ